MRARAISITLTVMITGALAVFLYVNRQLLSALTQISVTSFLALSALRILFMVTNGFMLATFITKFEIRLSWKEWFGLPVITTMGNYITPFSGGLFARAAYLQVQHGLPPTRFALMLGTTYLVTFWVTSVVGAILSISLAGSVSSAWIVFAFFAAVALSILFLLFLPIIHLPDRNRYFQAINSGIRGWNLVRRDRILLQKLASLSLLGTVIHGSSFWIAYHTLGFPVSVVAVFLVSLLSMFSILINITPANLGIQEAVIALSSTLLQVDVGQSLLVALIVRATTVLPVFVLGPVFSYVLTQRAAKDDLGS